MSAPVAAALKQSIGRLDAIEDESMRHQVLDALEAFRAKPPGEIRKLIGLDKSLVFEPDPDDPSGMVRIDPNGTRARGTIKDRKFIPLKP